MNKFLMHQAQKLQERLAKAQAELAEMTIEGSSGGGAVVVTITGHQKVKAIKISPEALSAGDVGMLEDLVLTAVNDAVTKSQEAAARHLGEITGGLKLPGM